MLFMLPGLLDSCCGVFVLLPDYISMAWNTLESRLPTRTIKDAFLQQHVVNGNVEEKGVSSINIGLGSADYVIKSPFFSDL